MINRKFRGKTTSIRRSGDEDGIERTEVVEKSLEAEALALERPRETQLRHISSYRVDLRARACWGFPVAMGGGGGVHGGRGRREERAVAVEKTKEGEVVYAEGFRWGRFCICGWVAFTVLPLHFSFLFHFLFIFGYPFQNIF
jgi:hypothetical protein